MSVVRDHVTKYEYTTAHTREGTVVVHVKIFHNERKVERFNFPLYVYDVLEIDIVLPEELYDKINAVVEAIYKAVMG